MNATASNKVTAANLQAGNIIDPPAAEKIWLWRDGIKRRATVLSVANGKRTKKGQFVRVSASIPSPYRNEEPTTMTFDFLESKVIPLK